MMQNLSIIETENYVLQDRYRKLRKLALLMAKEIETTVTRTKKRETLFKAVEMIREMTK